MAARKAPKSLLVTLQAGDTRESLEAMRDVLAEAMDAAPPTVVAQIAARLESIVMRLESLPKAKAVSKADDLAARRKARRATTAARASAAGEGNK